MPFVLFLFFGLWFLLICAKDRGKQINQMNNFPSCLRQEEYLKFYEYLIEYRQDATKTDPIGDAREAAGQWIYDKGHLPYAVRAFGRADWQSRPVTRRNGFHKFEAHELPSYRELSVLRNEDSSYGNQSMRGSYLKRCGKDVVFDHDAWAAYCAEINAWFVQLNERYNIMKYQHEQNRPTGYALEYLLACCKMFQTGSTHWERYHVRLAVLRCGFLPTSLKPRNGHKETRKCEWYIAQYPPQREDVERLLKVDEAYWNRHGQVGFEQYRLKIEKLFLLSMEDYQRKLSLASGLSGSIKYTTNVPFHRIFNVKAREGKLEYADQYSYSKLSDLKWE